MLFLTGFSYAQSSTQADIPVIPESAILKAAAGAAVELAAAKAYIERLEMEREGARDLIAALDAKAGLQAQILALKDREAEQLREALQSANVALEAKGEAIDLEKRRYEDLAQSVAKRRRLWRGVAVAAFLGGVLISR